MGVFRDTASAVRVKFQSDVAVPESLSPVYDNAPIPDPMGNGLRARVLIDWIDQNQLHIRSSGTQRVNGFAMVTTSVGMELGDGLLFDLDDKIKAAFRRKQSGAVNFEVPSVLSRRRNGIRWVHEIRIPFWADFSPATPTPMAVPGDGDWRTIAAVCRGRFKTLVATPEAVLTQYDNAPIITASPSDGPWVNLGLMLGSTQPHENPGTFRTPGVMFAEIRVPVETGDGIAYDLVDKIADEFRLVTDSGVSFRVPSVDVIGQEESWWRLDVTAPFVADQME